MSDPSTPSAPPESWRQTLKVYLRPRVIAMLFLGFSAGLPFLLLFSTLSVWLREADVARSTIGFFSWVGLTFSIKVVWAPVVDRMPLPYLTRLLGRRRGWMCLAQIGIAVGLFGIGMSDPNTDLFYIAVFALLVAFSSATQDISIDAYRIEAVKPELQGAMAATYIYGYRIALLAAGAGALFIADYVSWPAAYFSMAGLVGVGLITVLAIDEPEHKRDEATAMREQKLAETLSGKVPVHGKAEQSLSWFSGAVISPIADFFARMGPMGWAILLFIGVYRISDITMGIMANPFYIDLGFTKSEIASISKIFGFFMSLLGTAAGGVIVARYGIMRPLLLGAVLVALTNLFFAALAIVGADITFLTVTISADNFSAGLAGTVFIAYLSSLTNTAYTATQYALFSSLFTLPGKFIGGFSGIVVDDMGYMNFFIYAAVLGLPAIMLTLFLMRYGPRAALVAQVDKTAPG